MAKSDAAAELAQKMIAVLETQRGLGPEAYPLTCQRLVALADPACPQGLISKALTKKTFSQRVLVAAKKAPTAPVALREDVEQLAASPLLLQFALEALCTPTSPTCPVSRLKS